MQRKLRFMIFVTLIFSVLLVLSGGVMAQDEKVATIALFQEPATLDHRNYALNPSTFAVVWQIYEPLVYHDTRTDELIPGLAESWEQLDEDSYQFNLRVTNWHDGEPFTAEDVAWSYTRTDNRVGQYGLDPENPVEIIDDHTIIVNTNGPQGPFLRQNLALNMYILPEHILEPFLADARVAEYEETTDDDGNVVTAEEVMQQTLFSIDRGDLWTEPETFIGTGPFAYESWDRGQEIHLVANDDYWAGRPNIDRLIYRWVEDDTSRVIGLESGDFDMIIGVPTLDVERLQAEENIEVIISAGPNYRMLSMNQAVPALSDVRVRQAINYAVDQEEITSLYGNLASRTCGPLANISSFYNAEVNCYDLGSLEANQERARELLAEAGWDSSTTLTITITANDADEALLVQQYLDEVGINVEISEVDPATFRSTVRGGESELALNSWGNVVDPDHMYWVFSWSGLAETISGYQSETFNDLVITGQSSTDSAERFELYTEAQRVVVDDDSAAVFLYTLAELRAIRSDRLTGIESMPRPTDVFYFLRVADIIE